MALSLVELPIPTKVAMLLKDKGITTLYPPQEEAVKKGIFKKKNLVMAAPTASGKTLIAELVMLKNIFENRGKAIYLVPLRAIASEKYKEFKKYEEIGIKVAITTGDYDSSDQWLANYDIIITTNEKADSLLRHNPSWINNIAVIVADEIHLINDEDRGPTLEVVLTRLMQINPEAQIIALSATINNADEIAHWLNAELVVSNWRPVPLKEGVCYRRTVQFSDGSIIKVKEIVSNATVNLALHGLLNNGQVLVFTNTRRKGVKLAQKIADVISNRPFSQYLERESLNKVSQEIISSTETTQLSRQLAELVVNGVVFHHAGLHYVHREIIENAYRNNIIKIIVATPTLAAGVNLPARYVIIDSVKRYDMRYGYSYIPILEYKQMVGRAGRPQYDDIGYAITIARSKSEINYLLETYVMGNPEDITSKLANRAILVKHILASIAAKYTPSLKNMITFFSRTFYGFKEDLSIIERIIKDSLSFLLAEEFVVEKSNFFSATRFGERVSQLYIDPYTAIIFRNFLLSDRDFSNITAFGLLHLICHTPDMPKLNISRNEVYEYEDILEDRYDQILVSTDEFYRGGFEYYEFLSEVKTASLLEDWINEKPEDLILDKYNIGSGDLLRLKENAEWLLYAVGEIAKIFGKDKILKIINDLKVRVKYGVKQELLELAKLEGVGRIRARILYNAGYTTIEKLRSANQKDLERLPYFGPKIAEQIISQLRRI